MSRTAKNNAAPLDWKQG